MDADEKKIVEILRRLPSRGRGKGDRAGCPDEEALAIFLGGHLEDDASTAHLMSSFYRNLKTKTKVESLRQAQLELIRGKANRELLAQRGVGGVGKLGQTPGPRSLSQNSISISHPYFWAPFILVGDGK